MLITVNRPKRHDDFAEYFNSIKDSLVKKTKNYTLTTLIKTWNTRKATDRQALLRYTNLISLTFLACGKYGMSSFGKTGMIQITQLVHDDSVHEHLRVQM